MGGGEGGLEGQHIWRGRGHSLKFSISLISCDVHSLVKRDVQLDVKHNDSPSDMMQSDALSCQLT